MIRRTPVKKRRAKPRRGREADREYLEWILTQPCSVQPCKFVHEHLFYKTEAHHAGDHGMGQKANDRTAIPLCNFHHREGRTSVHVLGKMFWRFHGLDRDKIIMDLNQRYEQERAA
jgi:hypothetical protein